MAVWPVRQARQSILQWHRLLRFSNQYLLSRMTKGYEGKDQ